MKTIGGFFELELNKKFFTYHPDAVALTSARSCFSLLIESIKPSKIYVPYYICDTALIPLRKYGIKYEYYALNIDLEPIKPFQLAVNEYFLYVNYFGLMNSTIDTLYSQYSDRLIIDNTQAFFEKKYKNCWSFNSARKFFGVPDGGYVYCPKEINTSINHNTNINYSHLIELVLKNSESYNLYVENEKKISSDILRMSILSEKLLSGVNYSESIERRKNNFSIYAETFSKINYLQINQHKNITPFCYPLWIDYAINRHELSKKNIFIPILWRDVCDRDYHGYDFEKKLSMQLIPLPIDQRYNEMDCRHVIQAVNALL